MLFFCSAGWRGSGGGGGERERFRGFLLIREIDFK